MNTPFILLNRLNLHERYRFKFFFGFCLALVTLLVANAVADESAATRPPNIILIVADDLGYTELGCQWKAIRTNLRKKSDNKIQLYDLSEDIGETNDVAAEHPELVDKMAAQMRGSRRPSKLFKFPALDQ